MTRLGWISAAVALAAVLCSLALFALRARGLPARAADGAYVNDCCGKLVLSDGTLILGDNGERSVSYVIEWDEKGPFILPKFYVGPWENRGFQIDGSRPALPLRLDRLPAPTTIQLYDYPKSYLFRRQSLKLHGLIAR